MKRGLAISGAGGAIGFHCGALDVVTRQYLPDKIVGVSSGSLAGIMLAVGKLDRMNHILETVIDSDIVQKRIFRYVRRQVTHWLGLANPQLGVYDNSPLRGLLYDELIGQTVQIEFSAIAVNAKTRALATWTVPRGTRITVQNVDMIVSQIMSSTAIPGVFPPEKINGHYYIDGGVVTHTPIEPLKHLLPDCDHITIISTAGLERDHTRRIKTDLDYLPDVLSELIALVPERDFMNFKHKNKEALYQELIEDLLKVINPERLTPELKGTINGMMDPRLKWYPYTIIQPTQPLSPTVRFHYKYTVPDMEHGRERAAAELY